MKTISILTLIICFLLVKNISYGQMEKGSFFLGPQNLMELRFAKNFYKGGNYLSTDERISEYSITPFIGYFIRNNLSVGLIPSYQHKSDEIKSIQKDVTNSFTLTPFIRYYIESKKIKPFFDLGLGFKKIKSSLDIYFDPNTSNASNGFALVYNIGAGVSYMINDNISLDFGANYGYSKYNLESTINSQEPYNYEQKAMMRQLNVYLSLPFYFRSSIGN